VVPSWDTAPIQPVVSSPVADRSGWVG
jgi:hypothetical protein